MVFWFLPAIMAAAQGAQNANAARQNQRATNRAQRRFERLNTQFANEDQIQSYVAIAARRGQERKALFSSLDQVSLDASRRIGAASVAAGESGVHGNSSAALIRDFHIAQLKSEGNIMDTEKYMQEQYGRDVAAVRAQTASRILGGQQQRAQTPDYAGMFLQATAQYMANSQQLNAANRLPYGDLGRAQNPYVPAAGSGLTGPIIPQS